MSILYVYIKEDSKMKVVIPFQVKMECQELGLFFPMKTNTKTRQNAQNNGF